MSDDNDPANGAPAAKPDYQVGYGKPPQHGKIKPGEVRNKKRIPRGRSFKNEIRDVLAMPVEVGPPNRRRKVSTRKASILKLREKALNGNDRALDRLIELATQDEEDNGGLATTAALMEDDAGILARARERLARSMATEIKTMPAPPPAQTPGGPSA